MRVAADRVRKAQLKMRGLTDHIQRFSRACREVRGRLSSGPTIEFEHIDNIVNIVDDALVAIRTLDLEVYDKSDPTAYRQLRSSLPTGGAVRALVAPRNNAVHHVDVIDPDLDRAVGPIDRRYIIFPRWKLRSELPAAMFQHPDGKKKGQPRKAYIASYDTYAGGRLVLDTLLDAFGFFDSCDPSIADRDSDGKLVGYPLEPLPVAEYHRLSPEWPDHAVVHDRVRASAVAKQPAGSHREIVGWIETGAGPVLCGHTVVTPSRRTAFTEHVDQIMSGFASGYQYETLLDAAMAGVQIQAGALVVGSSLLLDHAPKLSRASADLWRGWWELCVADAYYYRKQRQSP